MVCADDKHGESLVLCDGKYKFYRINGTLVCDRLGDQWREFVGDKAISALFDADLSARSANVDTEAVAWALHRLRNFGVGHREEDAMMLDRLHIMTMGAPADRGSA